MPLIKSAIKKLRKDKKLMEANRAARESLKDSLKKSKSETTAANLALAFSALDKAVKNNLIKKAKAARLKSRLSKAVKPTKVKVRAKKASKS
jgi:ribosomal protein S20